MYPSWLTKYPLYSKPHFNLTQTCLPVKSCKNGFGLTGWIWTDGENGVSLSGRGRRYAEWFSQQTSCKESGKTRTGCFDLWILEYLDPPTSITIGNSCASPLLFRNRGAVEFSCPIQLTRFEASPGGERETIKMKSLR